VTAEKIKVVFKPVHSAFLAFEDFDLVYKKLAVDKPYFT
jgi:hypothetical protein